MSYPISEERPLRIGHRGAAAHAPHNTLTSFRKAAAMGVDMVELDVQRCADGQVVVTHDPYLTTPDGRVLVVHHTPLAELRKIDLGGGERVPTFPEVLTTLRECNLGILLELKDGAAAPLVIDALRGQDYLEHCVISSFRPDWLADFKAVVPQIEMSIQCSSKAIDGPHLVSLARGCGASFVCPGWESDPHPTALFTQDWWDAVRAAGLRVISWHEERPEEIAALKRLGVDAICSDRPELLP